MAFTPLQQTAPSTENDFRAIKIQIASPQVIRKWSWGEVKKAETINYRTLRPERDGLFCERIFGPTRDFECYCGKYKRQRDMRMRREGFVCDQCKVEVTRASVRRERMGHINLAAPVAHIWFSKGTPSRMSIILDITPRNLERVLYFSCYIITKVDEDARLLAITELMDYREQELARIEEERTQFAAAERNEDFLAQLIEQIRSIHISLGEDPDAIPSAPENSSMDDVIETTLAHWKIVFEQDVARKIEQAESLQIKTELNEAEYRELKDRFGNVFEAGMGADAILELLQNLELDEIHEELNETIRNTSGQRRAKAVKRLSVVEAFRTSGNKPEWMVLTVLPVLPPELHPMVQLDGGRFATSDLNDLYRRVINRNNRLSHLLKLSAPDIIVRNERRMLQEAVDALIDNGRRGRAIMGRHNHKLKSLTDLLRGKQGRFRQNLLGKRVDYSGRAVIISGPQLKLDECGIPKEMALELFKPFVMNRLIALGHAHNIKTAKRRAEQADAEVWDTLEKVVDGHPVLLNRAPTLHRLGIQAFYPKLVEGKAIQLHPLVCTAFNADFDGDQMAVHVPLSPGAINEAKTLMLSTSNMLAPRSGSPIVSPTLDMLLGLYYMTGPVMDTAVPVPTDVLATEFALNNSSSSKNGHTGVRYFGSSQEAIFAQETSEIGLRDRIRVRVQGGTAVWTESTAPAPFVIDEPHDWIETTVGRIIFNEILPDSMGFHNYVMKEDELDAVVHRCYSELGNAGTAIVLDEMKRLGFEYATRSGTTIAIKDAVPPPEKAELIENGRSQVVELQRMFNEGVITDEEKYTATIETWNETSDLVTDAVKSHLPEYNGVFAMSDSGAKGNLAQIKQMAGMRGLMSNPRGRIIDVPIEASFAEGLSVHEFFASTHGSRKALADTALKTAEAGYLTRRMADAAQNVIINERDCGSPIGMTISAEASRVLNLPFEERLFSRYAVQDVVDPETGEVIAAPDTLIEIDLARRIAATGLEELEVRSPVGCMLERGICARCYGSMLADNRPSIIGEAVGIVAAQSIGEPGTQLTMRNFHTGGIASDRDITTGLPRVQELFEARNPKAPAILSEIPGIIAFRETHGNIVIAVENVESFHTDVEIPAGYRPDVEVGDWVDAGSNLLTLSAAGRRDAMGDDGALALPEELVSEVSGEVESIDDGVIRIFWLETDEREYIPQSNAEILVSDGQEIEPGTQLTDGTQNPHDILRISGIEAVQRYLVEEAQRVYRSQGVKVHDKHFEVVVRQMLQKVKIESTGDSKLLIDEVVDRSQYLQANEEVREQGGDPATAMPVLLGISRVSLMSQSFLAKASFQETERVLTDAALQGSVDRLTGLKENVIIGRMIPARLDRSAEGRELLGLPDPEEVLPEPVTQGWEEALAAIASDDVAASLAAFNVDSQTPNVSIGFSGDDGQVASEPDYSNLASTFFGGIETPEEPVISFDDDGDSK